MYISIAIESVIKKTKRSRIKHKLYMQNIYSVTIPYQRYQSKKWWCGVQTGMHFRANNTNKQCSSEQTNKQTNNRLQQQQKITRKFKLWFAKQISAYAKKFKNKNHQNVSMLGCVCVCVCASACMCNIEYVFAHLCMFVCLISRNLIWTFSVWKCNWRKFFSPLLYALSKCKCVNSYINSLKPNIE